MLCLLSGIKSKIEGSLGHYVLTKKNNNRRIAIFCVSEMDALEMVKSVGEHQH